MELTGPDGYALLPPTAAGQRWVAAAREVATRISAQPRMRAAQLRHAQTWFVGVDVLPNAADGAVAGVPFESSWRQLAPDLPLHRGQLSIIYPGYPGRDPQESLGAQRFRQVRAAGHVDGLLPVGAKRRRFALEHHAYILGVPLNQSTQAPTLVWPGSHEIMQAALSRAIGANAVAETDITDSYQAARKHVFETSAPVPLTVPQGGAFLLHRFAVHGTASWEGPAQPARLTAFFRPELPDSDTWLRGGLHPAD